MTNATDILPLLDLLTKADTNSLANMKFDRRVADVTVGSSGGKTLAKHDCLPVLISVGFF